MTDLKIKTILWDARSLSFDENFQKMPCLENLLTKKIDIVSVFIVHQEYMCDHLVNNFLEIEMNKIGYKLEIKVYHNGHISKGTEDEKMCWKGMSVSIFGKLNLNLNNSLKYEAKNYLCDKYLISRGGILIKMTFKNINIGFLGIHMPFNKFSISNKRPNSEDHLKHSREECYDIFNKCFNSICEKLIFDEMLNGVILMGNMNYCIKGNQYEIYNHLKTTKGYSILHDEYDELNKMMKDKEIPFFSEGVNQMGPKHKPYSRNPQGSNIESYNEYPHLNWYDRILYQAYEIDNQKSKVNILCTDYGKCNKNNSDDYSLTFAEFNLKF